MKVFQRAVQKQLVDYLSKYNILCKEQSGFRKLHSTQTATLDVTDFISTNMDRGALDWCCIPRLKKGI